MLAEAGPIAPAHHAGSDGRDSARKRATAATIDKLAIGRLDRTDTEHDREGSASARPPLLVNDNHRREHDSEEHERTRDDWYHKRIHQTSILTTTLIHIHPASIDSESPRSMTRPSGSSHSFEM